MITREVLPARLSRRAIVFAIALVAATGAVLCANLVAGERERSMSADLTVLTTDPCVGCYAIDPYSGPITSTGTISGTTHHEIGTFGTVAGAYRIPPHETRVAVEIVVANVSYFFGIDSSDGTHHDAAVCRERLAIGSDDCAYFDEAALPVQGDQERTEKDQRNKKADRDLGRLKFLTAASDTQQCVVDDARRNHIAQHAHDLTLRNEARTP